jgi:hypothetical protein
MSPRPPLSYVLNGGGIHIPKKVKLYDSFIRSYYVGEGVDGF